MPLSQLDERVALLVIDLQQGVVSLPLAHPVETIVARSVALIRAFRQQELPVVLVNVDALAPGRTEQPRHGGFPAGWSELIPELEAQDSDLYVTKSRWGAFHGTRLHELLQERGVTQVVVCGIATGSGVESTARNAHELGYNVVLATDAMTDMSAEVHHNSVTRIFPRLGETCLSGELLSHLDQGGQPQA